jgi:hypothetical protein
MSRHCPRILDDHISAYTTKSPCMSENLFSYKAGARTFVGLITKTTGAHTRLSCIAAIHNYKQIPLGELRESTLTQCGGTVPCSTSTFLPYAATNYNTYFPPRIQLDPEDCRNYVPGRRAVCLYALRAIRLRNGTTNFD